MEYYDRVADAQISADFYFEFRRCLERIADRLIHFLSTLTIIDD
jgi:hypothetical protein